MILLVFNLFFEQIFPYVLSVLTDLFTVVSDYLPFLLSALVVYFSYKFILSPAGSDTSYKTFRRRKKDD